VRWLNQGLPLTGDVELRAILGFVTISTWSGETPVLIEVLYTAQGMAQFCTVHVTLPQCPLAHCAYRSASPN